MVIKNKLITAKILTTSEISRIVLEGIGTVFFFIKHILTINHTNKTTNL